MKKILLTLLFITTIFAQDVFSVITSGNGPTKDQATTAALRNAIESKSSTLNIASYVLKQWRGIHPDSKSLDENTKKGKIRISGDDEEL